MFVLLQEFQDIGYSSKVFRLGESNYSTKTLHDSSGSVTAMQKK